MLFGLNPEVINLIREVFQRHSEIIHVKIFGSRALGNYRPNSDVDLVCYGDISEELLATINSELDELPTPYLFDIAVYSLINHTDLKEHIDNYGKLLYCKKRGTFPHPL